MSKPLELSFRALSGTPDYPTSDQAAAAAEFASQFGDYRIARALLTLACELADLEADQSTTRALASAIRSVPKLTVPMRPDVPRQPRTPESGVTGPTGNGDADLRAIADTATDLQALDPAPYACGVCGIGSTGGDLHKAHMRLAHGIG